MCHPNWYEKRNGMKGGLVILLLLGGMVLLFSAASLAGRFFGLDRKMEEMQNARMAKPEKNGKQQMIE